MSTHTTFFCDHCNRDRDISHGDDEGHAINHDYPVFAGWVEFEEPATDAGGYSRRNEIHICAHCIADPEFEPHRSWSIPDYDGMSQKNFDKGRAHAEAYAHAQETLGTRERWFVRGVRQVFDLGGSFAYGYLVGPKMADGRFATEDRPLAPQGVR